MKNYEIKDISSAIMRFNGKYLFLSNFYEGNSFEYKGYLFENSEAAFHSQKCPSRIAEFQMVRPSQSKRLGRLVPLRHDWEDVKDKIMYEVCRAKFTQDEKLKQQLLATGDRELVEGNYHGDRCWGMTFNQKTKSWVGQNRLGLVLMRLREDLRDLERMRG